MNESQEIFTPEQFRVQAAELRDAVAELHRRDSQTIDPQNPFGNETEFRDYNSDYGYIVPQIRIPGCQIPVMPSKRERKRIRKYNNIVGGGMLVHTFLSNLIALFISQIFYLVLYMADRARCGGTLPENYEDLLSDYFSNSSAYFAMTLLAYMISNVAVALLGCKLTKTPVSGLFQTRNFTPSKAVGYMAIALCLQTLCGYLAQAITGLMEDVGVTAYEADFSTSQDVKAVLMMYLYSCVVAPVTEELLFRGFVLKNLSRVSQRFGIVMSAFLFGIWHENISQFVLAFLVGIFFGYLTVKHNSLIPSMLAHAAVNTMATLFEIFELYELDTMLYLLDLVYIICCIVGLVLLVRMLIVERLPATTPHQAERGLRTALTSPALMIAIAIHVGLTILYIVEETV
jgi:hypothetical protein